MDCKSEFWDIFSGPSFLIDGVSYDGGGAFFVFINAVPGGALLRSAPFSVSFGSIN